MMPPRLHRCWRPHMLLEIRTGIDALTGWPHRISVRWVSTAEAHRPTIAILVGKVRIGRVLFSGSLAALGLLSLGSGDFALNWQPVPATVPWREELARASGLLLLATGIAALMERTAAASTFILTLNVSIWLLALQLPRVVVRPTVVALWLGFAETLMMVAAGSILTVSVMSGQRRRTVLPARDKVVRVARLFFAVALPMVGLSHFVYVNETTALVPVWLPNRPAFAYMTGVAHIAAGTSLIVSIVPRLAAMLEAAMISSFTLLVWVPRVAGDPVSRSQWTALLASALLTGAAWVVAGSFSEGSGSNSQHRLMTLRCDWRAVAHQVRRVAK